MSFKISKISGKLYDKNLNVIPFDTNNENYLEFETWLKQGNQIIYFDGTEQEIAEANAPIVPKEVANMNFRLALIHFGIFPSLIDTAFAYMPEGQGKEEYLSLWNFANTMERNNPKLIAMALEFGINSTQLDEIFKYANTL
jgi:hypothetical protein